MASKILVGVETRKWTSKKDGSEQRAIALHMVEDAGCRPDNVIGQRVIIETLWGISDIEKEITVQGKFEVGCHITVYYEGEGDFKKPTLIMCTK